MVRQQLECRDITDQLVLAAMAKIEREQFIPAASKAEAYYDGPLPIGYGQTISQPYIVALMTQSLELTGSEHVLEIGTGSGYAAAVLGEIAESVVTIESLSPLADRAKDILAKLQYANVCVLHGDGTKGYPQLAPYDAIVVTAGGPEVPASLISQLKPNGRLVIPVGRSKSIQDLIRVTVNQNGKPVTEKLGDVRFVPLIGEQGWSK
jgi:protein-L-isoaspartate(D-aspartate) O-methyltransferase